MEWAHPTTGFQMKPDTVIYTKHHKKTFLRTICDMNGLVVKY